MAGYLFVYFIGEQKDGEQIYFSISRDGLHWQDLNGFHPVLRSAIGERGVRDPFCVRDEKNGKFYLIATDLRIEAGKGWDTAQYAGSRDLIVWESEDLVSWSKERAVTVGVEGAGCVWAPEAIYDVDREAFLVFWASMVRENGEEEAKQRIYSSYTKDFRTFTPAQKYLEKDCHVIDTTMLYAEGSYYRFSKDETTKRICMESAGSLDNAAFDEVESDLLSGLYGVEGPEIYELPDGRYCLIVDQFAAGKGYLPLVTDDLQSGRFTILPEGSYDLGVLKKRHGGVMKITDEEYDRLLCAFDGKNPVLPGLFADPDIAVFDGTYYLYPTTDGFDGWSGTQFYVFSSRDGVHFGKGQLILDVASGQVPWATGYAWAPCITKKGDTYYYYFCAKNKEGISCIGMARAKDPKGPFTAMEEPLVTMELVRENGLSMCQTIDPSIYQEDGEYYLLFGNGNAAIGRLNETMDKIVPGTMKNLEGLTDFREAVTVLKRNGKYHFTWSCDDTGSEDYHINYGTSDSLYGPVTYHYAVLEKEPERDILGTGHHSITKLPDEDIYLIAYHRFGTPLENYPEGKGYHRETCLGKVEFGTGGLMKKVRV